MFAACDTFRSGTNAMCDKHLYTYRRADLCVSLSACLYSFAYGDCIGAVEQLNVHAKRLQVELFERGYRSDPTVIAIDAIRHGE